MNLKKYLSMAMGMWLAGTGLVEAFAQQEEFPWAPVPLVQVRGLNSYVSKGVQGKKEEPFIGRVMGSDLLSLPGRMSREQYFEEYSEKDPAPTEEDFQNYQSAYFEQMLLVSTLRKMFEGEGFYIPLWHEPPTILGDYAAIYTVQWYASEVLKIDLEKNPVSYESIYQRILGDAPPQGIRLTIDWTWCKYQTKVLCEKMQKQYPRFRSHKVNVDLPATWREFNSLLIEKMHDFFIYSRGKWMVGELQTQELAKLWPQSKYQEEAEFQKLHKELQKSCETTQASECETIKNYSFESKECRPILKNFLGEKLLPTAWKNTLKVLSHRYVVEETYNLCRLAESDSRYFCNRVNMQNILDLPLGISMLLGGDSVKLPAMAWEIDFGGQKK